MNIGLIFIHEQSSNERQLKQKETDELIKNFRKMVQEIKIFSNIAAWIGGTIGGPIISFFKKNGFSIAIRNFGICFFI